jgi:predicted MFS family arabinose efflux permease
LLDTTHDQGKTPGNNPGKPDHSPTDSTPGRSSARRSIGFWLLATTVVVFFAASSAPSPLYVVYQQQWHFSALTLTLVFASYALALLVSLLTFGGLSDFIGRRPVIAGALAVELLSMVFFLSAHGVAALFAARIVQGLATGAAAGAMSAGIADLTPPGRASLTAAVNTAAPAFGLAVGALASGALVQYAPDPRTLIYAVLTALFAALLAALVLVPESANRRPGALHSLLPRAAVPVNARRAFRIAAPVLIATWAVGGVMLSLGPSLAVVIFGAHSHLIGGLVVTAVAGTSSAASVIVRSRHATRTMVHACLVLVLGMSVVLISLATESTVIFFAGLMITGAGFGAGFVSAIGSVAPLATAAERAELFASLYVVSYGGFGGSAVLAGLAEPHFGLRPTAVGFGFVVIALALLAAAAELRSRRAPAQPQLEPAEAAL